MGEAPGRVWADVTWSYGGLTAPALLRAGAAEQGSVMDIILVPGFWLDASSWEKVTPPLAAAGHTPHPMTLPGLESADAPRAGISL